jgi:hypothetical protein
MFHSLLQFQTSGSMNVGRNSEGRVVLHLTQIKPDVWVLTETFSTITLLLFKDRWLVNGNDTTDYTVDVIGMQLICATLCPMYIFCMTIN